MPLSRFGRGRECRYRPSHAAKLWNLTMKQLLIVLSLLFGGILMPPAGPAAAADLRPYAASAPVQVLPFARGKQAQSVWASRACWSDCGAYCAWGLAQCLERDTQGACLTLTDRCDRVCQSTCRTKGGPLLGWLD